MAVRTCPQCLTVISAAETLAYSNSIECSGCKKKLAVSDASRFLATLAGLLAAVLVWRLWGSTAGMLGWVKPVLVGFFAFSIVTPVALAFLADLRLKPEEPVYDAASASGHGHH
jgi:hypothetical protein